MHIYKKNNEGWLKAWIQLKKEITSEQLDEVQKNVKISKLYCRYINQYYRLINAQRDWSVIFSDSPVSMLDGDAWSDKKCGRYRLFSDSESVYFCEFPFDFLKARDAQILFAEKPQRKIRSLEEQNTSISII